MSRLLWRSSLVFATGLVALGITPRLAWAETCGPFCAYSSSQVTCDDHEFIQQACNDFCGPGLWPSWMCSEEYESCEPGLWLFCISGPG